MSNFNITYRKIQGSEIANWIEPLASLRIEIFKEWPYLYEGTMAYERSYLDRYSRAKNAFVSIAFNGSQIVGASTGLPLSEESQTEIIEPFLTSGFDPAEVFYFGESVIKKSFRGQGIGSAFMQHREDFARRFPLVKILSFCAVQRPENHRLRPANYRPLVHFWKKQGFQPQPQMLCHLSWQDLDQDHETRKSMMFWTKNIGPEQKPPNQ